MSEPSIAPRSCLDCNAEITPKSKASKPDYCADCTQIRRRTASRDAARRRAAGIILGPRQMTCEACNASFEHGHPIGRQPKYCPPCREGRLSAYQRNYRIANGRNPLGSVITILCTCGAAFDYEVIRGRRPWKCRACRDEAYMLKKQRETAIRRVNRRSPNLSRICVDCGCGFQQKSVRGPIIVRCPECTTARTKRRQLEYGRQLSAALSEARAVTFAAEGRWSSCLGCGKRLTNQRMGIFRERCEACLPAHKRQVQKAWKLANPEAWRAISYRMNQVRRSRLAGVESEPYDRGYILERDKWICQHCKKKISRKHVGLHALAPSIDHQIPLALGGADKAANVVACHVGCNRVKGTRYLPQGEQLALLG